jgi:hypothetical protein
MCTEVWRFTGLANYLEGSSDSEVAAPLTVLGSSTARFAWPPEAQPSFDSLKRALSSAQVLCTFDPPLRAAVLTTDASGLVVAAILTQPDDQGQQHPVANESLS